MFRRTLRRALVAVIVAGMWSIVPVASLAAGPTMPGDARWVPTAVTTTTTHVPCSKTQPVCTITSTTIDYGHWVFVRSPSAAGPDSVCSGWTSGSVSHFNAGWNVYGYLVWQDTFVTTWRWNYCDVQLTGWTHTTYTNVGFWLCGGVSVWTYWSGGVLHAVEMQGFGEPFYSWDSTNNEYSDANGSRSGSGWTSNRASC